jgi:hypothetical protein
MQKSDSLLHDPIFYLMLGLFALLTTGLAAALGQPRFLPFSQTVALFAFLAVAFRRQRVREALWALALWLVVQMVTVIFITWLLPGQVEQAMADGFHYRSSLIGWFHGAERLPASVAVAPVARLVELAGILVGSLVTGGLVGLWFLVRAANLAAYSAGVLWQDSGLWQNVIAGLPLWTVLRLAGYAGFVVLLAEPLFSGNWSLRHYLHNRRSLLVASLVLVSAGLLLEITLPGAWRSLFA